jgi:hypothetical protein
VALANDARNGVVRYGPYTIAGGRAVYLRAFLARRRASAEDPLSRLCAGQVYLVPGGVLAVAKAEIVSTNGAFSRRISC